LTRPGLKAECAFMTIAIAVAAVLAVGFAFGSLIMQVDGATLRRWRLSRRWDVSRLAREFIKAADEPLATLHGLTHMINAWERGARRPSERYWLLYLRLFPECVTSEVANGGLEAGAPTEELSGAAEVNVADLLSSASGADQGDIRALAATVRALQQQVAGLSRRVAELSRNQDDEGQPRERSERAKTRPGHWRANVPSLGS
jgi:hypothetical protein